MRNGYGEMHGQETGTVNELVRGTGTNVSMVDGNMVVKENGYDGYGFLWGYGYGNRCEEVGKWI